MPRIHLSLAALGALLLVSPVFGQSNDLKNAEANRPNAAASPNAGPTDEAAAAGAVARRFYDDYVQRFLRAKGKKPGLAAWIAGRADVSPQFKRVFAQADAKAKRSEMGGWEADPIINAQDFPDDGGLIVKSANVSGLKASLVLNWERGMDAPVQVTLLRFPDGWKIHGIGDLVAK